MEYLKINDVKEGMVIAFNYTDQLGEHTHRVITVKEANVSHILGWCHTKKNFRQFITANVTQAVQVQCETPKDIVGVGTTVYMVHDNTIRPFTISDILQDAKGYHYNLDSAQLNVTISNPKYFNTTKTACANEWLKHQGLPEITKEA